MDAERLYKVLLDTLEHLEETADTTRHASIALEYQAYAQGVRIAINNVARAILEANKEDD